MGTYLPVPPGQPAAGWLIAHAGARVLPRAPQMLDDVPAGMVLVAVVTASHGDAALLVAGQADADAAVHAARPVLWLLISQNRADALTGSTR